MTCSCGTWALPGRLLDEVLWEALQRRLAAPGTWLTLGIMLTLCLAILIKTSEKDRVIDDEAAQQADELIVLLVLLGVLLTLVLNSFTCWTGLAPG